MKQILLLFATLFISCSTVKQLNVSSHQTIAKGVDVFEVDYTVTKGNEQLPTKIFIMDVNLSKKITILTTVADDNNASIKATK